tara:strand:+ start:10832 stop:11983 length:1152 start_codon:yes stop_codon:yes gene_type:complete
MKFLILGTLLNSSAFNFNLAANPASTKWLRGFVGGLESAGSSVQLCGHCYARAWPKGPLIPGEESYLDNSFPNRLVRFLNLPGLRFKSMAQGYFKACESVLENQPINAIVTYNPYPWHVYAARKIREKWNIPWICLNLDFDDVGGDWRRFLNDAGDADGHLFLSHWGYENAPVPYKIHLDSGVSELAESFNVRNQSQTVNIVYLGKLGKSGGLEILLSLPRLISAENVRFIYGGKGYPNEVAKLKALAAADRRVDFRGFVEDGQVAELFDQADLFINPRDPEDVVNDMVFPSKIMHYLQTGKTVVSTWTKGLAPEYRDLMLFAESPSAEDFADAVRTAVRETTEQRQVRSLRIKEFLKESRLWSGQAKRFDEFVATCCERFSS